MARRNVRKLTCWSDEEWRRVADAASPAGLPPLIGKAFPPGTGFGGLARYLEQGHPGAEVPPHRVEWMETRNLPTDHPHAAARIMAATARDSDSIQPPVYHFLISFDPS